MHNLRRSDAQLQQVRCTTLVGRMHNLSMSDAQLLQVGSTVFVGLMHNFSRSDAQHQQVGCTTFVGRMHNFCWSDAHILQFGCTHFVVRMHSFVGWMNKICSSCVGRIHPTYSCRRSDVAVGPKYHRTEVLQDRSNITLLVLSC